MRELFLSLLRSGLWGQPASLPPGIESVDWDMLLETSIDQTIAGLVADGIGNSLSHLRAAGIAPSKDIGKRFAVQVIDIEQRNIKMNKYLSVLMRGFEEAGLLALVVKGQGIGLNYIDPHHRSAGDIDLLVRHRDYESAKRVLMPFVDGVDTETPRLCHLAANKDSIIVELHGTLRSDIKYSIDRRVFQMQEDMFEQKTFTENDYLKMPSDEFNAVFIFTHILQHFFKAGIGFRQVCDWCRFLYVHREGIDKNVLRGHLNAMHIMSEWAAFGNMAVRYLGMPQESMPFYSTCDKMGDKVLRFLFESGNFGRLMGRDSTKDTSYLRRKWNSLILSWKFFFSKVAVFPLDTGISYCHYLSIAFGKMLIGK